jgi:DICT domain-containing protein
VSTLAIKDVSDRTGLAAGTIRMWEQRYGFPEPQRTDAGYRRYSEADVEALRRVITLREGGLSVPAAIDRARRHGVPDRPSLYAAGIGADPGARPQVLRKPTLIALSRAIEHEALAQAAAPVLFAAFQREPFYRRVEQRYRRLAGGADAAAVFADFPALRRPEGGPVEVPIARTDQLGNEWAVIVDAPGYAAALLAWELPEERELPDGERRFEAMWTIDPHATRKAAEVAAALAGRHDAALGEELTALLAARDPASRDPLPALTALTNRVVAYLQPS